MQSTIKRHLAVVAATCQRHTASSLSRRALCTNLDRTGPKATLGKRKASRKDKRADEEFKSLLKNEKQAAYSLPVEDKRAARSLRKLTKPHQVLELLESDDGLSVVNIATGLSKIIQQHSAVRRGKSLRVSADHVREQAVRLEEAFLAEPERAQPRTLSSVAWITTTLGTASSELLDRIADDAVAQLGSFNSKDITQLLYAFSRANRPDETLFRRLGPLVERHTRTFLPMELSSILLAYTSVGRHSDPVVTTLISELTRRRKECNIQSLSNTVYAMAKGGMTAPEHNELWNELGFEIGRRSRELTAQGLANVMWAFAKAEQYRFSLYSGIVEAVLHGSALQHAQPQHVANLAAAFAKVAEAIRTGVAFDQDPRMVKILSKLDLPAPQPRHGSTQTASASPPSLPRRHFKEFCDAHPEVHTEVEKRYADLKLKRVFKRISARAIQLLDTDLNELGMVTASTATDASDSEQFIQDEHEVTEMFAASAVEHESHDEDGDDEELLDDVYDEEDGADAVVEVDGAGNAMLAHGTTSTAVSQHNRNPRFAFVGHDLAELASAFDSVGVEDAELFQKSIALASDYRFMEKMIGHDIVDVVVAASHRATPEQFNRLVEQACARGNVAEIIARSNTKSLTLFIGALVRAVWPGAGLGGALQDEYLRYRRWLVRTRDPDVPMPEVPFEEGMDVCIAGSDTSITVPVPSRDFSAAQLQASNRATNAIRLIASNLATRTSESSRLDLLKALQACAAAGIEVNSLAMAVAASSLGKLHQLRDMQVAQLAVSLAQVGLRSIPPSAQGSKPRSRETSDANGRKTVQISKQELGHRLFTEVAKDSARRIRARRRQIAAAEKDAEIVGEAAASHDTVPLPVHDLPAQVLWALSVSGHSKQPSAAKLVNEIQTSLQHTWRMGGDRPVVAAVPTVTADATQPDKRSRNFRAFSRSQRLPTDVQSKNPDSSHYLHQVGMSPLSAAMFYDSLLHICGADQVSQRVAVEFNESGLYLPYEDAALDLLTDVPEASTAREPRGKSVPSIEHAASAILSHAPNGALSEWQHAYLAFQHLYDPCVQAIRDRAVLARAQTKTPSTSAAEYARDALDDFEHGLHMSETGDFEVLDSSVSVEDARTRSASNQGVACTHVQELEPASRVMQAADRMFQRTLTVSTHMRTDPPYQCLVQHPSGIVMDFVRGAQRAGGPDLFLEPNEEYDHAPTGLMVVDKSRLLKGSRFLLPSEALKASHWSSAGLALGFLPIWDWQRLADAVSEHAESHRTGVTAHAIQQKRAEVEFIVRKLTERDDVVPPRK